MFRVDYDVGHKFLTEDILMSKLKMKFKLFKTYQQLI